MTDFWSITLVVTLLVMSPGPAFAVTVDNSLHYGRLPGIKTAFGIALGDLCHIIVNLAGLSFILMRMPHLMMWLQIMGALYFLYIGTMLMMKTSQKPQSIDHANHLTSPHLKEKNFIKDGFFVGLLNPKAGLFYLNFFAVMLPLSFTLLHKSLLSVWILVIVFVWFSVVALCLGHSRLRRRFLSYQVWIKRLCGSALIYFGALLLWEKLSSAWL